MEFSDKVAVVYGADTAFGRAVSLAFVKAGASVGIAGTDGNKLAETLALLQPIAATAHVYAGTLAEGAESQHCVDSLSRGLDERIDILINVHVSGQAGPQKTDARRTSAAKHMSAAADHFLTSPGGRVINVTSSVGLLGAAGDTEGAIAAGGLIAMSRSSAKELAPRKITVNCVCVGPTDPENAENVPMKRPASAADVIPAILFLASDRAQYVTGLVVSVDGGHSRLP